MRMKKMPFFASSGVALIVVLWAVSLISTAMLGLAAILQGQLGQEIVSLQSARAGLVAESGIQMALNPQVAPAEIKQASVQLNQRLSDGWKVPVHFEVEDLKGLKGEEGKLNINALLLGDKARAQRVLQNLFAAWGVNLSTSTRLIDTLIDWVDSDSLTQPQGAEEEDYKKQKRTGPRNGPFESIDELKKVLGWEEMEKETREAPQGVAVLEKFTVFGSGKLTLLDADQDVLEAWLDLPSHSVDAFIEWRKGQDQALGTSDDPTAVDSSKLPPGALNQTNIVTLGKPDLWRVTSTGYVGEAKRTVVALISRNPPQIKARWTQEEGQP